DLCVLPRLGRIMRDVFVELWDGEQKIASR
ncbi:hypothetical protein WJX79_001975, partial [Trebouxia sp. C0005]